MKARGYLVRVRARELDETFLGLSVLLTPRIGPVVTGGISDLVQCHEHTDHCPLPVFGALLGAAHTHLWLGGGSYLLMPATGVVVAPPEAALEPAPRY